jgi:hypothetical protein
MIMNVVKIGTVKAILMSVNRIVSVLSTFIARFALNSVNRSALHAAEHLSFMKSGEGKTVLLSEA